MPRRVKTRHRRRSGVNLHLSLLASLPGASFLIPVLCEVMASMTTAGATTGPLLVNSSSIHDLLAERAAPTIPNESGKLNTTIRQNRGEGSFAVLGQRAGNEVALSSVQVVTAAPSGRSA